MAERVELTPEEQTKSYSKYYYLEPFPPDPELLDSLRDSQPIAATKALPIEQLNKLLDPGYLPEETGYCVLLNGAGYVAVHHKMPSVTVDMINWWFAWHALEDLRYKIWWPRTHFAASVSDEDRKKILRPGLPDTSKFQGITHHVIEDVGMGRESISIRFLTPDQMGFDMERFKAPAVATLIAGNGLSKALNAPEDIPEAPVVMCHFIREIPNGIEFRTRFWLGYQIIDKKPRLMIPPHVNIPAEIPARLFRHNIEEYAHLRAILPQVYREQGGKIT